MAHMGRFAALYPTAGELWTALQFSVASPDEGDGVVSSTCDTPRGCSRDCHAAAVLGRDQLLARHLSEAKLLEKRLAAWQQLDSARHTIKTFWESLAKHIAEDKLPGGFGRKDDDAEVIRSRRMHVGQHLKHAWVKAP